MSAVPVLVRYFAWDSQSVVAYAMRGDRDAWQALLNRHYAHMYRYAAAYCGAASAEDIAARVFEAAVENIGHYRGDRPFIGWLYEIARDVITRRQRQEGHQEGILRRVWPGKPRADAVAVANADPPEARSELARAIGTLTGAQREAMTLRYLAGLSTEEISAVTGRTPTAVYALEARAVMALQAVLTDEAGKRPSVSYRDGSSASRMR